MVTLTFTSFDPLVAGTTLVLPYAPRARCPGSSPRPPLPPFWGFAVHTLARCPLDTQQLVLLSSEELYSTSELSPNR